MQRQHQHRHNEVGKNLATNAVTELGSHAADASSWRDNLARANEIAGHLVDRMETYAELLLMVADTVERYRLAVEEHTRDCAERVRRALPDDTRSIADQT